MLTDNGWTSVVLVTDPWHAARSGADGHRPRAVRAGLAGGDGPSLRDGVAPGYVLREALGILYYRLTGGSVRRRIDGAVTWSADAS